jgi:hypothetical protein
MIALRISVRQMRVINPSSAGWIWILDNLLRSVVLNIVYEDGFVKSNWHNSKKVDAARVKLQCSLDFNAGVHL